jgi:hypothetical protein
MRQKWIFPLLLAGLTSTLPADEGMWLLNRFPKDLVLKKYKFQVTDEFLRKLQLGSVRFNSGGSGSFVSEDGLMFTNHHVGSDCIQKVSTAEHNYMANGFMAASRADEKACPDLEVNVLLSMEDVTSKVQAAKDLPAAEANRARLASIARIEKECADKTGNRCDVVPLFSGGQFHLYQYKKWTDVRLVFAPEEDIAAFGGDPDNFNYPRYCLDFAFFRAYENGKPVKSSNYFKWSKTGARDKELTFVPGNPGSTGRLATMTELEFYRDYVYPLTIEQNERFVKALLKFGETGEEHKRVARDPLLMFQNSVKARKGFESGLLDKGLMDRKRAEEAKLRAAVKDDPAKQKQFGAIWEQVATAYAEFAKIFTPYTLIEQRVAIGSDLLRIAREIVRYAEEKKKPNGQRLREYTDSALPAREQEMFSAAPISNAVEIVMLAETFKLWVDKLGANFPVVAAVLKGRTPLQAAEYYVNNSHIGKDIELRKKLAAGGKSDDSMIELARIVDAAGRQYRKQYEDMVEAVLTGSASKIAQARYAIYGANEYPDATFTMRVTYGDVRGYKGLDGKLVPWATDFAGLYKRATGVEPYKLPQRWLDAKSKIALKTPFNFVTTTDTHGGNSGSPTLDTKGEIVGILFDGNIEGLPNRFVFTDAQARSVHVASQGIIEALRKVYGANAVLKELGF